MDDPDWYHEWRHEAVHLLQDKNALLDDKFRLRGWPRFDYDLANRQLVFASGAIVLGTGGSTYDRFVRDRTFRQMTEYAQTAYVPSLETPVCFVGYRCKQGPRDWLD